MCGIAGIFDATAGRIPEGEMKALVERMVRAIKYRGPDDDGVYCARGVGIGASRLSIIDLSPSGHMPMRDERTGNYIVHNGEVYNYKELREALGPEGFRSKTDTEVILKSYAKHGEECVRDFNGMYAFCIWDPNKRMVFCARDRLGIKPFFYAVHNGVLYFASEIKSLLQCGVPARPNMKIIYEYLVYGVYEHSEETFFEGIKQLPAGCSMTAGPEGLRIKRYWDISPESEGTYRPAKGEGEAMDAAGRMFRDILTDSVRLRLRSDVPIGVNVSGGLDSAFIMATINDIAANQGSIKAFSYYYNEEKYDEKPFVEELVGRLGWRVENYCRVTPREVPSLFDHAMWHQEQPFPGMPTLAKHKLLRESARFDTKVILEGQGGDEIGGGYQYFFGPHIIDLCRSGRFSKVFSEVRSFALQNGMTTRQSFIKIYNSLLAYYKLQRSADGTPFTKRHCLNQDFLSEHKHTIEFKRPFKSHLLNMQYRDIFHTKLPRILRSCDRASMAYGRELRVPVLDYRLVEFTFTLPGEVKIDRGIQRLFMRKALKTFFRNDIVDMPKRAVVDPQREWMKDKLADWLQDIFFSESFKERPIFDAGQVRNEFLRYCSNEVNVNSFHLWQWLSLEIWFRKFIDQKKAV